MRERERESDRMRVYGRKSMCVCAAEKKTEMKERRRVTGDMESSRESLCGGDLWGRWWSREVNMGF